MKHPTVPAIPTKAEAAEFLRDLARDAGKPLGCEPKQRATDLRLIADLIEGKIRWRKMGKHSWNERMHINLAAKMIDRRPPGQTVSEALDNWARRLAGELRRKGPDAEQALRDDIEAARKRRRAYLAAHPLEK